MAMVPPGLLVLLSRGGDGSGPGETPPHLVNVKADPLSLRRVVAS